MKQSDIVTIVFVALIGVIATVLIANAVLNDPDMATMEVKTIDVISSDVDSPNSEVFNAGAINPTVEVYVGSCVDENGDGVIDQSELHTCGGDGVIEEEGADEE